MARFKASFGRILGRSPKNIVSLNLDRQKLSNFDNRGLEFSAVFRKKLVCNFGHNKLKKNWSRTSFAVLKDSSYSIEYRLNTSTTDRKARANK
jgi:hypothetical protein